MIKPVDTFLKEGQTLKEYYEGVYKKIEKDSPPCGERQSSFTHAMLLQPAHWFEALAVLEYSIRTDFDTESTDNFLQYIFRSYDCYASFGLSKDDYDYYWEKVNEILDLFSPKSTEAIIEKGLQHFCPRREYGDHKYMLGKLQEAANRGSELGKVLLGYYLYMGFCGVTDKEKGLKLIESVTSAEQKQRAIIYKGFILMRENKVEEAKALLGGLAEEEVVPSMRRQYREQQAVFLQMDGKLEEASAIYREILEKENSGFALMYLGFFNYNRNIEGGTPQEGIRLMEEAFRFGRPDVVRSLFHCYYNSEQEWQDNERAMYWLHQGYLYYDGYATYQLACFHLYVGENKDLSKGLDYLEKALALNYADAFSTKGDLLSEGNILEKDFTTALAYYEKAAELNSLPGCQMAGRIHLTGVAGTVNIEKALYYYEKGAEMGSPYCQVELSIIYEEGDGVKADPEKAFRYAQQAARSEYPYAYYLLGRYYKYAIGTAEDPDEAIRYFKLTVEDNNVRGITELALCYEGGYGVEADDKKALEYMTKAAELGYAYAQYKLGCYYLYGLDGVATDNDASLKWMSMAAEQKLPFALLEMGDYYLYDYANIDEQQKAYGFYVEAEKQGYVSEGLGACYEYGIGVEMNDAQAFKYYLKGAEMDYVRAMFCTGRCYYYGSGIKENISEAFRWFNDASAQEYPPAVYFKGKMLLDGEGCNQNMEEGIACLKMAAEANYAEAQYLLGNCYLVGKGVEANDEKAEELFELAADNGHEQAQKITGRKRKR